MSQPTTNRLNFKNVVIVGAGPVGLYCALILRHKYPHSKIVIFEKRSEYTRTHQVKISSLKLLHPAETLNGVYSIKFIEEQLRSRLRNVEIVNEEITEIEQLLERDEGITDVIFANGARSSARNRYFDGEYSRTPYAQGCYIKYEREPNDIKSLNAEQNYRISKLTECYVNESVKNGTSVHINLIGQKVLTAEEAHRKMCIVVNARRVELSEKLLSKPLISTFPLELYESMNVKSARMSVNLFLVGDAAVGLPYQCGLSAGLSCARALVQNPESYPERCKKIKDSFLGRIEWKNASLNMYLNFGYFWKGTIFEWQRWSRPYEQLLLRTDDVTSKEILESYTTKERHLILDRMF